MLKGVNQNVIEVNNPESRYFDRAILFLKEVPPAEKVRLEDLADAYLRQADNSYRGRIWLRLVSAGVRFLLAAGSGAAAALLFLR